MDYTNFTIKINNLRKAEIAELKAAIIAHGGKYEFSEGETPIITINYKNGVSTSPEDVEVTSIEVNDKGELVIFTVHCEEGYRIKVEPFAVFTGHISSIITYIPETDKVKDVSITPNSKLAEKREKLVSELIDELEYLESTQSLDEVLNVKDYSIETDGDTKWAYMIIGKIITIDEVINDMD